MQDLTPYNLTAEQIAAHLHRPERTRITVERCVTSTNTLLKEQAAAGAPEGTLLVALSQTAGRGRLGRTFHSPEGTGLYFSLLLRPTCAPEEALMLTVAIAAAATETIDALTGRLPGIKWVNDLYLDDRKLAGILTEAAISPETGRLDYAVVGIGINVEEPENGFPSEIADIAGALYPNKKTPAELREQLVAGIVNRFYEYYEHLADREFFEYYRTHSCLIGREVLVTNLATDTEGRVARAIAIDEECHLVVEYEDGQREALQSGDVRLRLREK